MLSDSGGILCILKRFGSDGAPEVMFAHGDDYVDALVQAERALAAAKWRPDKPQA